jgi:lipopolysaccharide transport system permease protein
MDDNSSFETVITARSGWFDINLRELWRYRDLALLFVRRNFIAYYKQTILGPAWAIIQPLLTTVVFTIVFGGLAKLPTDGVPPFLFYMCGNIACGYFAGCLNATGTTFTQNAAIFGKVYFPRLTMN